MPGPPVGGVVVGDALNPRMKPVATSAIAGSRKRIPLMRYLMATLPVVLVQGTVAHFALRGKGLLRAGTVGLGERLIDPLTRPDGRPSGGRKSA
ncbi:MAG: hypothetical protein R2832_08720 [Rhodothermales bacterium]